MRVVYIITCVGNKSGGVPERPKGTDCKSVGSAFEGSNPSPSTFFRRGMEQLVARRAHNPKAGGSSPSPATMCLYSSVGRALPW